VIESVVPSKLSLSPLFPLREPSNSTLNNTTIGECLILLEDSATKDGTVVIARRPIDDQFSPCSVKRFVASEEGINNQVETLSEPAVP
jgi:hypothetical protein